MRVVRGLVGLLGLAVAVVGFLYLSDDGISTLTDVATWLVAGVVIHDGLLAMAVVLVGVAAARTLPTWARAPVAVGFIVLGTVTVTAIPVLGRFGARPDNQTLLDRDYTAGWLVLTALTAVAVVAGCFWQRRAARRDGGAGIPAVSKPRPGNPDTSARKA